MEAGGDENNLKLFLCPPLSPIRAQLWPLAPKAPECLALPQLTSVYCKFLMLAEKKKKKSARDDFLWLMFAIFISVVEIIL